MGSSIGMRYDARVGLLDMHQVYILWRVLRWSL